MARPIHDLTEMLSHLPGLGPRQARRVVQYLLTRDQPFRDQLADMVRTVAVRSAQCTRCYHFDDAVTADLCHICNDTSRDHALLVVVEHDVDVDAIEASLTYRGYYFVLGGHLTMTKPRRGAREPRTAQLLKYLTTPEGSNVSEVVMALATTPEGDFTAHEVARMVKGIKPSIRTSLLGRGLSVGAEIEYADPETVRNAFKNRS